MWKDEKANGDSELLHNSLSQGFQGSGADKLLTVGVFQEANSARSFPEDTHPLQGGTGAVWKAQGVKKLLRRHY